MHFWQQGFFIVDFKGSQLHACVTRLERRRYVKKLCVISCCISATKISKLLIQNSSKVILKKSTHRIKQPKKTPKITTLRVSHFDLSQQISLIFQYRFSEKNICKKFKYYINKTYSS